MSVEVFIGRYEGSLLREWIEIFFWCVLFWVVIKGVGLGRVSLFV